jgi:hypothetical protein
LVPTGLATDALVGAAAASRGQLYPMILPAGFIGADASASNTGQIEWTCFWTPLIDGATVVAV